MKRFYHELENYRIFLREFLGIRDDAIRIELDPTPPCGHPSPGNGRGVPGGHKIIRKKVD